MEHYAKTGDSAIDPELWSPIKYWDYWDFARQFAVHANGAIYVLDAGFVESDDEYSDYFKVYRVPAEFEPAPSLEGALAIKYSDLQHLGEIPVSEITFDKETRKSFVRLEPIVRFAGSH